MRIAKFKVSNYRSISDSKILDLHSMSVLVGPNNEGKSNILRALTVGLQAIRAAGEVGRGIRSRTATLRYRRSDFREYDWSRDFPVHLQEANPKGASVFDFELELNEKDRAALKRSTGHSLNDLLKLRVRLAQDDAEVKVIKRGPANRAINDNLPKICNLVAKRVRVEYIAGERTSDALLALVQGEAFRAIEKIQRDEHYNSAMDALREQSKLALFPLEKKLTEGIASLVPSVTGVKLALPRFQAPLRRTEFEVLIDDGALTLLSAKGDGIQSLAVIAMIRALALRSDDATYILAIEEPESHLHPDAIRRIREDLLEFAKEDQVVITTHSPILVNREEVGANILVEKNAAAPAKSLSQIRESLGVMLPDNMQSTEVVVLTEGPHDVRVLSEIMSRRSPVLARALGEGRLQFRSTDGSGNLAYHCRVQREAVCRLHVVLDDDKAGLKAVRQLEAAGDVETSDITILKKNGMWHSELEDLFEENTLAGLIEREFGVSVGMGGADQRSDFSTRMKACFDANGRPWTSHVEARLKSKVAQHVVDSKDIPTDPLVEPLLANLQETLEEKLREVSLRV